MVQKPGIAAVNSLYIQFLVTSACVVNTAVCRRLYGRLCDLRTQDYCDLGPTITSYEDDLLTTDLKRENPIIIRHNTGLFFLYIEQQTFLRADLDRILSLTNSDV